MRRANLELSIAVMSIAVIVLLAVPVSVEAFQPTKPVEIIAPASPGGGWDLTARAVSAVLQQENLIGVPTAVLNITGGSGTVALAHMSNNRRSDPHSLAVFSPSLLLVIAGNRTPLTIEDMTPVVSLTADYGVLVVREDSPFRTLKDVLDAFDKDPKAVAIAGGSAPGGQDHIGAALLLKAAGRDPKQLKFVAYQSGGDGMLALLGGHVPALFTNVSIVLGQLKAHKVRVLAVFSDSRLPAPMESVPTGKELGIDFVYPVWRGIYAPPGISADALEYWSGVFSRMVNSPAWKAQLDKYSWLPNFIPAERFGGFVRDEVATYQAVLRNLGLAR